ncbi:hypothetical protein EDB84DRAFT_1439471 [Lactarius hengduanensis]|nr:hypothetical protein EDB84DRAFT_1439471 [Lactarius hengduanensis]
MWQLLYVLPYLLATTGFVLPSVLSLSSNGPFQAAFPGQAESLTHGSDREWNSPPNPNSTHHLIFNSVSGLLQQWPNTLRRNGHTLIPATIPKGTILYHGRADFQIPISPDWVAFDFEFSAMLCIRSCHMISLQAKRDLRLVYFDGLSVAKTKDGPLDSQDVLLPLGLDGFVRMVFHFEVMICDFLDGMEVVSFLDLIPLDRSTMPRHLPGIPGTFPKPSPPKLPSGWRGSPPDMRRDLFEAYVTGTWHDRAPGESRVRPDYSGLVTFYDPSLSSLVEARHGKDRLHLRLEGISALDTEQVRDELRTVLTRERDGGSGIDWGSIVRVVTERYAGRLEYLRFLLSPDTTTFADTLERAAVAREQLLVMLAPYITTTDLPQQLPASANLSWAAPVAQRCATTQTSLIPFDILTPQEARIHAAVENTLHEICRRLVLVWAEFFDVEAANEAGATEATEVAYGHISELMSWLDWSEWMRCEPGCSLGNELPPWPIAFKDAQFGSADTKLMGYSNG